MAGPRADSGRVWTVGPPTGTAIVDILGFRMSASAEVVVEGIWRSVKMMMFSVDVSRCRIRSTLRLKEW